MPRDFGFDICTCHQELSPFVSIQFSLYKIYTLFERLLTNKKAIPPTNKTFHLNFASISMISRTSRSSKKVEYSWTKILNHYVTLQRFLWMLVDMMYDFKIYVYHLNIGKPNMTSLLQTFTDNTTRPSTSAKIKVVVIRTWARWPKTNVAFSWSWAFGTSSMLINL